MKTTLSRALLELNDPVPKDYDIEEADFGKGYGSDKGSASSDGEDEDQTKDLRSHYVQVGKSKLRKETDLSLDNPKYRGVKVSRKDLSAKKSDLNDLSSDKSDHISSGYSSSDSQPRNYKNEQLESADELDSDVSLDSGAELDSDVSQVDSDVSLDSDVSQVDSDVSLDSDVSEADSDYKIKKKNKSKGKPSQQKADEEPSAQSAVQRELEKLKVAEKKLAVDMNEMKQKDALKGKHVINQIKIWESTLDLRIRFQKILHQTNELPTLAQLQQIEDTKPELDFTKIKGEISSTRNVLGNLLIDVANIQPTILEMIPSDQLGISSKKRKFSKLEADKFDFDTIKALWDKMESNRKLFKHYRDETLLKWDSRVNHLPGNLSSKNLKVFNKNVIEQIDQMLNNKERLLAKTRVPRVNYRFIVDNLLSKQDDGLETNENKIEKEIETIYDDADFYQSLLKDLIDSRSSASANVLGDSNSAALTNPGLQWATIQKSMNNTKKKTVDTKASKGRKIRYQVFEKLENFMAPQQQNSYMTVYQTSRLGLKPQVSTWTEEQTKELYSSLIGTNAASVDNKADSVDSYKPATEIEAKAEENMDSIRLFNF
ncbi:hypothetical protein BB561_003134 [Smittium simulii]|uniref:Protein BFR2 n=1 Tax=Smittium simulii TaxID=133385 RepID=A0A2T9YMV2_9FUNG|nr:hypothetical protein BB561_003134 [Smittium simulii]